MHFHFLFILSIFFCVNSVKSYRCRKQEHIEKLYYPEEKELTVIQIICTNVDQQTVFNHSYENEKYPQDLYIEDDSNNIPILHSNSSIEKFAGIRKLFLRKIKLEVISPGVFDSFETLEELTVKFNRLHKISNGTFNRLKNLKLLDLSFNDIKIIEEGSFSNLYHLHTLKIADNRLPKIFNGRFNNLENLKKLDLDGNSIEIIEEGAFSGLFHLENLFMSNNEIRELDENLFRDLTALKTLELSFNNIAKLPNNILINLTNLTDLCFMFNHFTVVDFANFPKGVDLVLSSNYINSVLNWKKLNTKDLSMSGNQITELEIPENVVILDLPRNKIRNIINTFSEKSKPLVEKLYLGHNAISEIDSNSFKKMVNLSALDLASNQITIIRGNSFQDLKSIKYLDLSSNKIESIEPNGFKGINPGATIFIFENNLKVLKSDIFPDQIVKITLELDGKVDYIDLQTLVNSSKVETYPYFISLSVGN